MKLGIMGGTFDPIHYGHLLVAHEAGWRLGLDKVLFIPTGNPPHKSKVTAPFNRYEMVKLAIEHNPLFDVSDIEVSKPGYSYTVHTLEALHELYGEQTELYFITGVDAASDILNWAGPERIFQLARLVVAERPGYTLQVDRLQAGLPTVNLAERLIELDVPMFEVASHDLRDRITKGQPVRYLVPSKVVEYINREKLYDEKGAIL